jgi:8-oxo-dGTP pyrophosphatase MutT (NUDIX family)
MNTPGHVTARDAATVILMREVAAGPPECFMVRRHIASDFAPDVYVFPGGKVEEADRDSSLLRHVETTILRPTEVDFADGDSGFRIAALRELFEEAGVLLAIGRDGRELRFEADNAERFAGYRRALRDEQVSLTGMAESEGIRYTPGMLIPFAHWITPAGFPRRYNTRFFLALVPSGQEPLHDAVETTDGVWISPGDALDGYRREEFPLVFATEKNLERLARFPSLARLVEGVTPADLESVTPQPIERNGKTEFLLPGDPGYV